MIDESGDCEGIVNLKYPYYGWMCPFKDGIYLSFVGVYSHVRRQGLMRKLLEKLQSEYKIVKVPSVVSKRLGHLLIQAGFKETTEPHELSKDPVEVYVWRKDE